MKYIKLLPLFLFYFTFSMQAQVTFRGCVAGALGAQDYTLTNSGTTNDAGTSRNFFESAPLNFAQSCPAGVCELRIIWNNSSSRWEIQLDNDGPLGTPDYNTGVLYYNTTASIPNPPDLSLGSWVDGTGGVCSDAITTLSGDVQSSVSLPVELLGFNGTVSTEQVVLSWQTVSELNNHRFEIERSIAGQPFETVGTIAGAGTSQEIQQYSFTDRTTTWRTTTTTYRLKQVDFNGGFSYSKRIELTLSKDGDSPIHIYPNPVTASEVFVDYHSEKGEVLKILLLDIHGKIMVQQITDVPEGNSTILLPIEELASGIYFISLYGPQVHKHLPLIRQ